MWALWEVGSWLAGLEASALLWRFSFGKVLGVKFLPFLEATVWTVLPSSFLLLLRSLSIHVSFAHFGWPKRRRKKRGETLIGRGEFES